MTISEVTAASVVGVGVVALTFTAADIPTIILAVGTAGASLLTATALFLPALRAARQEMKEMKAVATDTLAEVGIVKGHVNSAMSEMKAMIKAQETQLLMQRDTIAKMEQTAALLAQAQIQRPGGAPAVSAAPALVLTDTQPSKTLKQIEKHTKETAENTAATDVTVNEIKKDQQ